jgi:two-component system response regulator VicR
MMYSFAMRLDAHQTMDADPTFANHAGTVETPERPLVMLIEDDFMLRSSLAELLRSHGYRVECYANGIDALKRLDTSPVPDLILLDIMLPYMDGVKFRQLQLTSPASRIPVVVITAVGVPKDKVAELRFAQIFQKPLEMPALVDTVRELCPIRPG